MEAHPVIGDRMLAPLALLESVRPIVRHHHERWDGNGYPDGLAGDEIPLLARIVAVADSIEAMSGQRPYRLPLRQGRGRSRARARPRAPVGSRPRRHRVSELIGAGGCASAPAA